MDLSNTPRAERGKTTIVIPVLNESGNVRELLDGIMSLRNDKYFSKISEIIFVDDGSTDGTQEIISNCSKDQNYLPIRLLQRHAKQGTVNAQLYGISHAISEAALVMDGDLQHPVQYIPRLIEKYLEGYDLVLASRYAKDGVAERKALHGIISRGANMLAKFMLPWVRDIKDPISGYFIINKKSLNFDFDYNGFSKLALNVLSFGKKLTVAEVPFHFKERTNGESKVATGGTSYLIKYFIELLYYRRMHINRSASKFDPRSMPEAQTFE